MRSKAPKFDALPDVAGDQGILLAMAQELKVGEQKETTEAAVSLVKRWSERERTLYVGKKLVQHYGCYGCHQVEAFATTTPIGTELTEWGSKLIERLEFNHAPIEHTHFDFAYAKLVNPRIYDLGMPRRDKPYERLRMPRFGFTPEEAKDIAVFLVGLVNDPIPAASLFTPDPRQRDILRGRQIVRRYNCQGCHVIEDEGGDMWPAVTKDKWKPPNLIGQGIKTQPEWLFRFLKDPTSVGEPGDADPRVRPWHSIRMPSFGLSDEEARALVRYFAALSGGPIDFETVLPDTLDAVPYAQPKTLTYPHPEDATKTVTARAGTAIEETRALLFAAQCLKCHSPNASLDNAAPSFRHTLQGRLRGRWLAPWLWNPGRMLPGTSMPAFFVKDHEGRQVPDVQLPEFFGGDVDRQIDALRDYIRFHYDPKEDR
jgi:mono/diheme cytochrome c family protein